jgi:hypothetical protein
MRSDGTLMAAEIKTAPRIEIVGSKPLFKINVIGYGDQYAVAENGKKFLVNERLQGNQGQTIVALDWMAELKK